MLEAAWALSNIASGNTNQTQFAVDQGMIQPFGELLSHPDPEVREQAVWGLSNIAGESIYRDTLLQAGIMQSLMQLTNSHSDLKLSLVRNIAWLISNLCRGKPQPDFKYTVHAVPALARMLLSNDEEMLADVCWAFSFLSDDNLPSNPKIDAVVTAGVVPRLVELLATSRNSQVQTPVLRTLGLLCHPLLLMLILLSGNIVTGDDKHTDVVISCPEFFPAVCALLEPSNHRKMLRKEAAWTFSNIAAGTSQQIATLLTAHARFGILDRVNWALVHGEFEVQRECVWLYWNIYVGGTAEQMCEAVRANSLPSLVKFMQRCEDTKTLIHGLDTVDGFLLAGRHLPDFLRTGENPHCRLFEECGGVDLFEKLQDHSSSTVFHKAAAILRGHFSSPDASNVPAANLDVFGSQPSQFGNGSGPKIQF